MWFWARIFVILFSVINRLGVFNHKKLRDFYRWEQKAKEGQGLFFLSLPPAPNNLNSYVVLGKDFCGVFFSDQPIGFCWSQILKGKSMVEKIKGLLTIWAKGKRRPRPTFSFPPAPNNLNSYAVLGCFFQWSTNSFLSQIPRRHQNLPRLKQKKAKAYFFISASTK